MVMHKNQTVSLLDSAEGPRGYAGLAHEVTVTLHQNKRG